ncbi:MAG: DNA repair protein RecN [Deltaproteobacteria bacterium]|nr:DNA repair protein RecN [Deltaproteobacteria bacterium]
MLRHLRVTNFAILSDVEIELGTGMNVLTGETGAGKSLIVEAVNLLRGGRASADIPRAGTDEAVVEAIVEVPEDLRARVAAVLEGAGLPQHASSPSVSEDAEGEVFIRRVIQRGGRSRTYVNGALTTAARLAELGALLIDLSGQHQHQGLVDPSRHLELLDSFARAGSDRSSNRKKPDAAETSAWPLAETMTVAWAELRRCDDEMASLGGDERAREARVDYLKYQLEELEGAAFKSGEDVTIEVDRARLASVDTLQSAARAAEESLYGGDDSARDRVAVATREIEKARRVDPSLDVVAKQLVEIETLIDDVADQLRTYADKLEGDPERLASLDERLALIRRMLRKHAAGAIDEVIVKATELRAELDGLLGRESRIADLTAARTRAEAAAIAAAAALTIARKAAAKRLEKQVGAALAELGMGTARVTVAIDPRSLGPTGSDRVELMLLSNKGEEARPLAKIASGGELSRIMLALKLALQSAGRADPVATYVFDEVDSGIGGATAQVVGSQIRAISSSEAQASRQVLCVTHLPQIAAFADHHFHVEKAEVGGRVETHVRRLTAAARKDELARMLGGSVTSKAKAHAAELLADAARPRKSDKHAAS